MKVEFATSLAGPACSYQIGDVADLDDQEAKRLIEAGFAKACKTGKETAAKAVKRKKPETAATR